MAFHPVFDFSPAELAAFRALTPDQACAAAAATRDHVLDRRQLAALGLDGAAITRRRSRRTLFRRHHGVYAIGREDLTHRGEVRAALLRCGRLAAVSRRSSIWLQDLGARDRRIHVTTTTHRACPPRSSGITLRQTVRWLPGDVVWVDGLPCTSLPRTLADLAAEQGGDFTRAWNAADQRLLLDVGPLADQIARSRPGVGVLRARLERREATPPTESTMEELFWTLVLERGMRRPVCQWPLGVEDRSGRVDFVFVQERVAVELDSRRWHAIQATHDADRAKDLALREAGFEPHRYTWRQLTEEAPRVMRIIQAALEAADRRSGHGRG